MADAPKPASAQDVIDALRSIDQSLKALVMHFGCNQNHAAAQQHAQQRGGYTGPSIATERDMDGKYGDAEVKTKDPRDWTGDSMRGVRFSQCSPEYLDLYAPFLDWMAEQEEMKDAPDSKTIFYKRRDAALARGWAKRLRSGWQPPAQDTAAFPSDTAETQPVDDDIPF